MNGNDLFQLAAKKIMIQVNREKEKTKASKPSLPKMSKGEYLFGALPFMIKCSINNRKKSS